MKNPGDNFLPKALKDEVIVQSVAGENLLYHPESARAYCLNETAAAVYQHCDGVKPVAQIAALLSQELAEKIDEDIVWLALEELRKESLLLNWPEGKEERNGLSRRELLTRSAAAMIALPLVASIAIPGPAQAQSVVCPDSIPCSTDAECEAAGAPGDTCDMVTGCCLFGIPGGSFTGNSFFP